MRVGVRDGVLLLSSLAVYNLRDHPDCPSKMVPNKHGCEPQPTLRQTASSDRPREPPAAWLASVLILAHAAGG